MWWTIFGALREGSDDDLRPVFLHILGIQLELIMQRHAGILATDLVITLWWTNILPWKMAIEIVDFPMKNCDFPLLC